LEKLAKGEAVKPKKSLLNNAEKHNREVSEKWCMQLALPIYPGDRSTTETSDRLVLDGNLITLQSRTEEKSAAVTDKPKGKTLLKLTPFAIAVIILGVIGCCMPKCREPEFLPQPAPLPVSNSTDWVNEPNKMITSCAETWNCSAYTDEKRPALRMQLVLKDAIHSMPAKKDFDTMDDFLDSLHGMQSQDILGVAGVVKNIHKVFLSAEQEQLPQDLSSQIETEKYFHNLSKIMLGEDLPNTRVHDILWTVMERLDDSAGNLTTSDLRKAIRKSAAGENKKELLSIADRFDYVLMLCNGY
jgi:hypothetical protein